MLTVDRVLEFLNDGTHQSDSIRLRVFLHIACLPHCSVTSLTFKYAGKYPCRYIYALECLIQYRREFRTDSTVLLGSYRIPRHPIIFGVINLAWNSVPGRNIARDPMGYVRLVRLLGQGAERIIAFRWPFHCQNFSTSLLLGACPRQSVTGSAACGSIEPFGYFCVVSADLLSSNIFVTRTPLKSHPTRPETMTLVMASNERSLTFSHAVF